MMSILYMRLGHKPRSLMTMARANVVHVSMGDLWHSYVGSMGALAYSLIIQCRA